jgi:hypothetical protein
VVVCVVKESKQWAIAGPQLVAINW